MIYFTVRRNFDGLVIPPQAINKPRLKNSAVVRQAMAANAVTLYGGEADAWMLVELTKSQYDALAGQTGALYMIGSGVEIKTLTLTSSAPTVVADGAATITITADAGEANYTGNIKFTVTAPNGATASETVAAIAGVASTTLDTEQVGTHTIAAESLEYGVKSITVEGV